MLKKNRQQWKQSSLLHEIDAALVVARGFLFSRGLFMILPSRYHLFAFVLNPQNEPFKNSLFRSFLLAS